MGVGSDGKVIITIDDSPIPDLEICKPTVLTDFPREVETEQLKINKTAQDAKQYWLIDKVTIYWYRKKNEVLQGKVYGLYPRKALRLECLLPTSSLCFVHSGIPSTWNNAWHTQVLNKCWMNEWMDEWSKARPTRIPKKLKFLSSYLHNALHSLWLLGSGTIKIITTKCHSPLKNQRDKKDGNRHQWWVTRVRQNTHQTWSQKNWVHLQVPLLLSSVTPRQIIQLPDFINSNNHC